MLGLGLHATVGLVPMGVILFLAIVLYPGDLLKREAPKKTAAGRAGASVDIPIPWIPLIAVCLIVTLRSWVYMSAITYMPMYFQGRDIALESGSLLLTVFLACGAAAGLYGGPSLRQDRPQERHRGIIAALSLPGGPNAAARRTLGLDPGRGVGGRPAGLFFGNHRPGPGTPAPLSRAGLRLDSGVGFGTGGLGAALTGYLADLYGLQTAFWFLTVGPLVSVGLAMLIRNPHPEPSTA